MARDYTDNLPARRSRAISAVGQRPLKILGIDPGTRNVGIGAIDTSARRPRLIDATVLRAPSSRPLPERLRILADGLAEAIGRLSPQVVAIERAFYGRNVASLIALGEGRGVALLRAAEVDAPIHEYSPAEVKKAVTGRGSAGKEAVARMVRSALDTDAELGLDATDALAVALCHANRERIQALTAAQGVIATRAGGRGRPRRGRGR